MAKKAISHLEATYKLERVEKEGTAVVHMPLWSTSEVIERIRTHCATGQKLTTEARERLEKLLDSFPYDGFAKTIKILDRMRELFQASAPDND